VPVAAGQAVVRGERLGRLGSTGGTAGERLHFELRRFEQGGGGAHEPWLGQLVIEGVPLPGHLGSGYYLSSNAAAAAPSAFVTTWDTNLGEGTTVTLALAGSVNATIDWGDGAIQSVTTAGPHVHDYGTNGVYTVSVTGSVSGYSSGVSPEAAKLIRVDAWGEVGFTSMSSAFAGWCVGEIEAPPSDFDAGATSWVLPRPVRGRCPVSLIPGRSRWPRSTLRHAVSPAVPHLPRSVPPTVSPPDPGRGPALPAPQACRSAHSGSRHRGSRLR
jgi:hypothetical protein